MEYRNTFRLATVLAAIVVSSPVWAQVPSGPKRLKPEDADRVKSLRSEALSPDGRYAGVIMREGGRREGPAEAGGEEESSADRGTSELVIHRLDLRESFAVKDAVSFEFSKDSRFVCTMVRERPPESKQKRGPESGSEPSNKGAPGEKAEPKAPEPETPKPAESPKAEPAPATSSVESPGTPPAPKPEASPKITAPEGIPPANPAVENPSPIEPKVTPEIAPVVLTPSPGEPAPSKSPLAKEGSENPKTDVPKWKARGQTLIIRELTTSKTLRIPHVESFKISEDCTEVFYVQAPENEAECGLYVRGLKNAFEGAALAVMTGKGQTSQLAWSKDGRFLSFFSNIKMKSAEKPGSAEIQVGTKEGQKSEEAVKAERQSPALPGVLEPARTRGELRRPFAATSKAKAAEGEKPATVTEKAIKGPETQKPEDDVLPARLLEWDRDRLLVRVLAGPDSKGMPKDRELARSTVIFNTERSKAYVNLRKPPEKTPGDSGRSPTVPNARNSSRPEQPPRPSRETRTEPSTSRSDVRPSDDEVKVEVWHWKDQKISPMKGKGRENQESLLAEIDLKNGDLRVLGDERTPGLTLNKPCSFGVAEDGDPYAAERTWDREYRDYYLVRVTTGERRLIGRRAPKAPTWSEDGQHLFWFENNAWQRIDPETLRRVDITTESRIVFEDDEWPGEAMGTLGRILPGGREILISDGFDLWAVPLTGGPGRNLTRIGNRDRVRFRHVILDDDEPFLENGRAMLLTMTAEETKTEALVRLDLETSKLSNLLVLDKDLGAPKCSDDRRRYIFTLQDSNECVDLWTAEADFSGVTRVTDSNPWLREYELPEASLVSWRSADGIPLQGILIPPAGYEKGRRYPTIVYMYEKLSQGLHQFRAPGLMLNPQAFAQLGYAVFLPDIVYDIGRPGMSAVKCVVPGVQRLIDLGIADETRVGLCGHSWGGYETAFIITQTRMFRAGIAGAPVINMTSAYNGIRWSTGIPRQFQYERTQSRIGGTLWEYPERFIANSGIFHLENVTTPVLIMFGNNDGAVPWYQGIEYYLGMRRLGKEAVLLEYKDEGHGLRGKANQLDYTKRIHEWFDHYLRGSPAAAWISGPPLPTPLPADTKNREASPPLAIPAVDPAK